MAGLFNKIDAWIQGRTEQIMGVPVIAVPESYNNSGENFFGAVKTTLRTAMSSKERQREVIAVGIDATPEQYGITSEEIEKLSITHAGEDSPHTVRLYLIASPDQTDKILSLDFSVDLESFVVIFAQMLSTHLNSIATFNPELVLPVLDPDGSIRGAAKVPLMEIPDGRDIMSTVRSMLQSGAATLLTPSDAPEFGVDRGKAYAQTEVIGEEAVEEEVIEEVIEDEDDSPYSEEALLRMYNNTVDRGQVDDSAVDFISAMMREMSPEQKSEVFTSMAELWTDTNHPKATSLLLTISELADDIPTAVHRYNKRLVETFGEKELPEEVRAQMIIHFHAALVQKIV